MYDHLHDHTDDVRELDISNMEIKEMPKITRFHMLVSLSLVNNHIEVLPTLPNHLTFLNCGNNHLKQLPKLPDFLEKLLCDHNHLKQLPKLPKFLDTLHCQHNELIQLPKLNKWLIHLYCCFNHIKKINFNESLQELYIEHNLLIELSTLPDSLVVLWCPYNYLTQLPPFKLNLDIVNCSHNQLIELPNTYYISELYCDDNNIQYIPQLNPLITDLSIKNNPIDDFPYENEYELIYILNILYNFKTFYGKEKIKAFIMNYVWTKIREPKIREQYSPANLEKLLNEHKDEDLLDTLELF
jgi:hypothetical protein